MSARWSCAARRSESAGSRAAGRRGRRRSSRWLRATTSRSSRESEMAIIKYKPTSPGRRGMSTQDFGQITKKKPEVKLLEHKTETAGRNNYGRVTSRFRGGGHKQRYRMVDFKRSKTGVP